jgi:hypothetical protein
MHIRVGWEVSVRHGRFPLIAPPTTEGPASGLPSQPRTDIEATPDGKVLRVLSPQVPIIALRVRINRTKGTDKSH